MSAELYVARESAVLEWNGVPTYLTQGVTTARAGHPLVERYPQLWKPMEVTFDVAQEAPADAPADELAPVNPVKPAAASARTRTARQ